VDEKPHAHIDEPMMVTKVIITLLGLSKFNGELSRKYDVRKNINLSKYINIHRNDTRRTKIRNVCACIRPLYTIDTILSNTNIHKRASQSTSVNRVDAPNDQNHAV
jgi:hypothetical protein